MTADQTKARGRESILGEILETVRAIDENVDEVLERLDNLHRNGYEREWYANDVLDDRDEYA